MKMDSCQNKLLFKKKDGQGFVIHKDAAGKFRKYIPWETALELTVSCYLNETKLVVNGEFNKAEAQRIYEMYTGLAKDLRRLGGLGEDPWPAKIKAALDACTFNKTLNSTMAMETFYQCSNEHLGNNCPRNYIDTREECDRYHEAYDVCTSYKHKCDSWPTELMLPEFCCNYPGLVSPALHKKCMTDCINGVTTRAGMACAYKCMDDKLRHKAGGKIDFAKVASALKDNAPKNASWDKAIDKAVAHCTEAFKGENRSPKTA
jgi:hypothetical protein